MTTSRAPVIVGHVPTLARLVELAVGGRLSHATLLTGPDGVGKTTIGEALAATLLDADRWPGGLQAHPEVRGIRYAGRVRCSLGFLGRAHAVALSCLRARPVIHRIPHDHA